MILIYQNKHKGGEKKLITNRIQYKNIFLFLALLTLLVLSISPAMAATDDALADSEFPKAQNDNQNTGQSQYVGPQSNNTTGNYTPDNENTKITGAPSIGPDGTVYLPTSFNNGTNNLANLYALTPDGTKKWNFTIYDGIIYDSNYNYISGSPAITNDGTIYITGGFFDSTRTYGFLYAINPDGTLKWKYILNEGTTVYMIGSPAIGTDGTIYFASNYYASGWHAKLNAVKPDGTLKWGYSVSQGAYGGNIASPAVGTDGTIYFAYMYYWNYDGQSVLRVLDQNGNSIWSGGMSGNLDSSALVVRDGIVYMVVDGTLYAMNPSEDQADWKYTITNGRFRTNPSIAKDGTIFIGGYYDNGDGYYYGLYAINPDGSLKWNYPTMYSVNHEAVIGADGTIYFGEGDDDTFFALNSDGTLKWSLPVYATSSAAIGSNDYLYFGVVDGRNNVLYIVRAAGSYLDNKETNNTENTTVNAVTTTKSSGNSIGMQETGTPLTGIVLAVLMVLGGLISTKRH